MKFFIILAINALALAQDFNSAENRLRGHVGHGGHHSGLRGVGTGNHHHRGRRDVDGVSIVEKPDILGDLSTEESRNLVHRDGIVSGHQIVRNGNAGIWGAHAVPLGLKRWSRDTELVTFTDDEELALENRFRGHGGRVVIGGHHGHGHGLIRGRREAEESRLTGRGHVVIHSRPVIRRKLREIDDLEKEENRSRGYGLGNGRVVIGHGYRGRRDVELIAEDSRNLGWGGRVVGVPGHVNVWNRGPLVPNRNVLKGHW